MCVLGVPKRFYRVVTFRLATWCNGKYKLITRAGSSLARVAVCNFILTRSRERAPDNKFPSGRGHPHAGFGRKTSRFNSPRKNQFQFMAVHDPSLRSIRYRACALCDGKKKELKKRKTQRFDREVKFIISLSWCASLNIWTILGNDNGRFLLLIYECYYLYALARKFHLSRNLLTLFIFQLKNLWQFDISDEQNICMLLHDWI